MSRFVIAHVLNSPARDIVNFLRKRYDPQTAEAIDAHVTLAGPCNIEVPAGNLSQLLQNLTGQIRHSVLSVEGSGTFLPVTPTSFLSVGPVEELCIAHDLIVHHLGWREMYPYHPHVTITEYLNKNATSCVYSELKELSITFKTVMDSISLLEKGSDGKWHLVSEAKLDLPLG